MYYNFLFLCDSFTYFSCLLHYLLFNNRDPLTSVLDLTIAYISKCDTCFCQKRTAKIGHV